jgi:MFS family permease
MQKLSPLQIVPLAALTAIGMLAIDLYLPALPYLAEELHTGLPTIQGTISVYMIALALSQLVWGAIADKLGMRVTLLAGIAFEIAASIACALASNITLLIVFRAIQGIGGGAATVVVPVLLRRRCSDTDAVRALSWVAMAESAIPAAAPVLGTLILLRADWRFCFWVIAVLAVLLIPFVLKLGDDEPLHHQDEPANYLLLLRHPDFLRNATFYGLSFGALVTFVASAPHLIHQWLQQGPTIFVVMQICGVSGFMLGAMRGGPLVQHYGADRIMRIGGWMQLLATLALALLGAMAFRHAPAMIIAWAVFCAGLGLRGPAAMTRTLSVPPALTSLASGFLMFMALVLSGIGTQIAGFLLPYGMLPVALLMMAMIIVSLLLQKDVPPALVATAALGHIDI